jgi:hypothetical protein
VPTTAAEVHRAIAEAVRPGHFFVGPGTRLEWDHTDAEEVSWEVFRGRLLDPAHTRQRRTFESWNIYLLGEVGRSAEPLLSVKWDAAAGQIHVVRAVLSYVHEGYDAGGNVILTREVQKWVRELVGTIDLADFATADELLGEVHCRLFQAVVGTSRLPLTSVEAPLPQFTFGELAYFSGSDGGAEPMRSYGQLVERGRPEGRREIAKFLETMIHAMPPEELPVACKLFEQLARGVATYPYLVFGIIRILFNDVSLSPFTDMPEKALALARRLAHQFGYAEDVADYADLLGHLLRQIGRHLTAYDLVKFHHAGANYPDALLLDLVLRSYLDLVAEAPALFLDAAEADDPCRKAKRLRRRGLRQAWLMRLRYRGHLVPDAPTSPGENTRVLPAPHARVPEEQIQQPHRRTRRLFADERSDAELGEDARRVLRESARDLAHPNELRELGLALYLDRPLGAFKSPGEPDQTPLFSYEAFSRSIARQRLMLLGQDSTILPEEELRSLREALEALPVSGMPLAQLRSVPRPGVVSLADAARAADDFIILRTTESSAHDFFARFPFAPLAHRLPLAKSLGMPGYLQPSWLILGQPEPGSGEIVLTFYEEGSLRKRLELTADPRDGYVCRAGVEYPRNGLRVRRAWEEQGGELHERDLTGSELFVRPS